MERPISRGDEVLADTGTVKREASRRLRLAGLLRALAFLPFICGSAPASAGSAPLAPTVLTLRADRVYVAADSGSLAIGDRLAFADRKHVLATGHVAGLLDGAVASVQLDSGTLAGVKKLDRLRVTIEAALPARVALLHVGIPAGARRSRVTACAACTLAAPPDWRSERVGPLEWRAIRDAAAETLVVRLFRDADDESIAWERGDVDVAVFWPDELSASQVARFRKSDLVVGIRPSELEVKSDPGASGDVAAPDLATTPRRDCPMLVNPAGRAALDRIGAGVLAGLPACVR